MTWFYVSLFGYFLNAVAFIISKIILTDFRKMKPAAYAFWVNFLGIGVLILIPFHFILPEAKVIGAAFFSGVFNTIALLIFYKLLYKEEVSQVAPLVGGITPLFVFVLAFLILGEILKLNQIFGFFLIVLGGFIASYEISIKKHIHYVNKKALFWSAVAAFCFAFSQVLAKYIFNYIDFFDGFIWRGIGAFTSALLLLVYPNYFREIKESTESSESKKLRMAFIFLVSQIASFLAFVLINYAFSLGSVSLINALSGVQYLFLFLFVVLLSLFYPRVLREDLDKEIIKQKVVSIFLIGIGVFVLFV